MGLLRATAAAALGLGLVVASAPPALAVDGSSYQGECNFMSFSQRTLQGDEFAGEIDAAVVVYSRTHGNVVNATVTCQVRVNGVPRASASGSGSGVVVVAGPITYTASDLDMVTVCTIVDFTSDSTPTAVDCAPDATTMEFPPQGWVDLLDFVFSVLDYGLWSVNAAVVEHVDPVACEGLELVAPGAGALVVTAEGDAFLEGDLLWDCPPYVDPQPDPPNPPGPPGPPDPTRGPTGAGYNDGEVGFLSLVSQATTTIGNTSPDSTVSSTCAFRTDRVTGEITVAGATAAPSADSARLRCRLEDAATGAVLYDETLTAAGGRVSLHDTVPAIAGKVTVCTEGAGVWGTRVVTVGRHCRPGLPI